jgi:5-methylcytosine-specific restriction endonuclease McrA
MNPPIHSAIDTFDTCVNAIGDAVLRATFSANRANIEQANDNFDAASQIAEWANLPRVPNGNPNVLIAGALSKQNLMDLYTKYMVGSTGPSRDIYDELLTAAEGLCPFCGGLGHVRTLDHYLPKANFPAYSVHPQNLVPCCRDCNSGKNASFGPAVNQQTLHPYLDQAHFFQERWVVANAHPESPILIRFECAPPEHWSQSDKARVRSHFEGYQLGYRFSVQSGAETSKVVQLRTSSLCNLTAEVFRAYLLDNANSADFVLNGWSRTMYAALAQSDWFLETDFQDPNWHLTVGV